MSVTTACGLTVFVSDNIVYLNNTVKHGYSEDSDTIRYYFLSELAVLYFIAIYVIKYGYMY